MDKEGRTTRTNERMKPGKKERRKERKKEGRKERRNERKKEKESNKEKENRVSILSHYNYFHSYLRMTTASVSEISKSSMPEKGSVLITLDNIVP